MKNFSYVRAHTLEQALELLEQGATALAGGQSLIPDLKNGRRQVHKLVDISGLQELQACDTSGEVWRLGAGLTHARLAELPGMLGQVAGQLADLQVRNLGTLGGVLAQKDPRADYPSLLLAAEASLRVASGEGERVVPYLEYLERKDERELIVEIQLPAVEGCYQRLTDRVSGWTLVGVCLCQGRIAVTGLKERAGRILGQQRARVSEQRLAAGELEQACERIGEGKLVDDYSSHLAGVLLRRCSEELASRRSERLG